MATFFRLHPADEDPERLLDPEEQTTQPWDGGAAGRCDKCGGTGRTTHECESCTEAADPHCPACAGKVRYEGECPACEGTGEVSDAEREGVSVFPDVDGLYRYMVRRGGHLEDAVLVELEGEESTDEDFDADEGALLVRPTRIVGTRPVEEERIRRAREQLRERGEAA